MKKTYLFGFLLLLQVACSEHAETDPQTDAGADVADMQQPNEDAGPDSAACTALFGTPSATTGLSGTQCQSTCDCGGVSFTPRPITTADLDRMQALTLSNPPAALDADPYEQEPANRDPDAVCGLKITGSTYELMDFASGTEAQQAGASVTHAGACGLCSSLQDLAVYAGIPDLTGPVRECGLLGFREGEQANLDCLADLGFSQPCAQIWYYNTVNTRTECTAACFANLNKPYHLEDGSLNACIQCDEDVSGPVFKAVAGRTRRNSGLATALCRPCDTVGAVDHSYLDSP